MSIRNKLVTLISLPILWNFGCYMIKPIKNVNGLYKNLQSNNGRISLTIDNFVHPETSDTLKVRVSVEITESGFRKMYMEDINSNGRGRLYIHDTGEFLLDDDRDEIYDELLPNRIVIYRINDGSRDIEGGNKFYANIAGQINRSYKNKRSLIPAK